MKYCKTCQRQADRSATGKPTYGDVEDREAVGILEYVDPKGKQTLPFANVMKKLNISREDVEAEAKEFAELLGTDTIPEEHFTIREAKRGRPEKSTGEEKPKQKKKVGRPLESSKVVKSSVEGDLISQLQAAADSSDNESVASSTSSRGRPRLSDEEKQRRAEAKAQAKAEREAAKEQAKQQKAQEKAQAKQQKEAAKRFQSLIDEITTLNSEVSTAMDLSTMPDDLAELKLMLTDLKKQKKADEKEAAAKLANQEREAAQQKAKAEREAAATAKRAPVLAEYMSLADEAGVTVTEAEAPKRLASFARALPSSSARFARRKGSQDSEGGRPN